MLALCPGFKAGLILPMGSRGTKLLGSGSSLTQTVVPVRPPEALPHSLFGARTPENPGQESLWPLCCSSGWELARECVRETKCVGDGLVGTGLGVWDAGWGSVCEHWPCAVWKAGVYVSGFEVWCWGAGGLVWVRGTCRD